MPQHELVLLSPYRYPGQSSLMLGNEDMAAWLNGWTALWHPALLWGAKEPPRCEAQYDHEQPRSGYVYAVPESPPLYLPDDWDDRVRTAGAVAFKVAVDRATTLDNLRAALREVESQKLKVESHKSEVESQETKTQDGIGWAGGLDLPAEHIAPFYGIGFGHLLQATLAEAMEHENLLDSSGFWDDVQHAIACLGGFPYASSSPAPAPNPETSSIYPAYDNYPSENQEWDGDPAPHLEQFGDDAVPPAHGEDLPPSDTVGEERLERSEFAPEQASPQATEKSGDPGEPALPPDASSPDAFRDHLRSAAQRLLSAREVLYPVNIHLLNMHVLDETNFEQPWPVALSEPGSGVALNVVASTRLLQTLAEKHPAKFDELKARVQAEEAEVCGGGYLEREEPYLPLDSQLWNLQEGLEVARELLGAEIKVFARKRFGYHPQLPLLLTTNGVTRALFLCFDDNSGLPQYTSCVVAWPSPDGKQVDAFVRTPQPADSPQTYFNLGHYWYKTTREDHAATLPILHRDTAPACWHQDLMELARLAPVLGTWTTFSRYFNDVSAGEYPAALSADEFHSDFLSERTNAKLEQPVSAFAAHLRSRRRLDAYWTFAALNRALAGTRDTLRVEDELRSLEDQLEIDMGVVPPGMDAMEKRIVQALADRIQTSSPPNQPGHLLLNPCAFARRVVLELEAGAAPLSVGGLVKACQVDGGTLRAVVEMPALGFAWIPREGPPGTKPMASRLKLGDQATHTIRNEFFEAEVDPATGALKAIRDHKTHFNRLGQRLVFNPGSRMVATEVKVTSSGPALGEIISKGELRGEQDQVLAKFTQRLRAWLGRPLLEVRIELAPEQPPAGYPWHAYYGCRFAWRDERSALLRGVNGSSYITNHPRPQTPDFLELRFSRLSTAIFPCGLPFHQRHEGRMLDIILRPEGETAGVFDLGIALDREMPMQTALGLSSPVAVVPTTKGPPPVGASGWLFHLDTPNLLMTRLIPGKLESVPAESADVVADAITARLYECAGHSGHAEFRCVRNPSRAVVLDARGNYLVQASASGDAAFLEVSPNDLVHFQVEF